MSAEACMQLGVGAALWVLLLARGSVNAAQLECDCANAENAIV